MADRFANPEDNEKNWRDAVDRAANRAESTPKLVTTLQSFAGNAELLVRALTYAKEQGVDVTIAAEPNGEVF